MTLANERVQTNAAGQVVLKLKTPRRDGTTHRVTPLLEFMQRLAALVPRPRLHPIRLHGVLAPSSTSSATLRAQAVPQEPEAPAQRAAPAECEVNCAHHRPARLSWTKLLKRVFDLDPEHCPHCGNELRIITAIAASAGDREDPRALASAGAGTATLTRPRSSAANAANAASGQTIPMCHRSAGSQSRATRIGCARGFSGPMDVARRQGLTRK